MSLTIELLPAQEQQIREEAERVGVSISEVVRRTIDARFPATNGASPALSNATLSSDEEREAEERIFDQLHANLNETREALGMRTL